VDKTGHPVLDLAPSEFSLTLDGTPQPIEHLDLPGAFRAPANVNITGTADLGRLAPDTPVDIVLLDEFNSLYQDMAFARYAFAKYLNRQDATLIAPTMLIAVSLDHFTVLQDYTRDKAALLDALDHHLAAYPWHTTQGEWAAERYATTFLALRRVAEATIGHPGHKNMIWLGRGMPYINQKAMSSSGKITVSSAVTRTLNELFRARVTLYTLDPSGVSSDINKYGDPFNFGQSQLQPYFSNLATATGGRNLYGRNDVDVEIKTSIQDGESFYALTYRDSIFLDNTRFLAVKIKVDRPGLKVITRNGYFAPMREVASVRGNKLDNEMSAELLSSAETNLVYDAIGLTVTPDTSTPNSYRIHLTGKGLPWRFPPDDNRGSLSVLVLAVTFDSKGHQLTHTLKRFDHHMQNEASRKPGDLYGFDLPYTLDVPKNAVRARFVIRPIGESTVRIGTAEVDLTQSPLTFPSTTDHQETPVTASQPGRQ
jgi:VWFA-related protein